MLARTYGDVQGDITITPACTHPPLIDLLLPAASSCRPLTRVCSYRLRGRANDMMKGMECLEQEDLGKGNSHQRHKAGLGGRGKSWGELEEENLERGTVRFQYCIKHRPERHGASRAVVGRGWGT
jgi:hypothetical protein